MFYVTWPPTVVTCEIKHWIYFKIMSVFYFGCNHVWNYFTLFQPLKLFPNYFSNTEHVGKYSRAEISLWNNFHQDYFTQTSTNAEIILKWFYFTCNHSISELISTTSAGKQFQKSVSFYCDVVMFSSLLTLSRWWHQATVCCYCCCYYYYWVHETSAAAEVTFYILISFLVLDQQWQITESLTSLNHAGRNLSTHQQHRRKNHDEWCRIKMLTYRQT